MAISIASISETDVTPKPSSRGASGTDAWTVALATATAIGTLAIACMMPFVALATVTAATMSRSRAAATIAAAWMLNQIISFTLLGYPPTAFALGWGVALGIASPVAMLVADRVLCSRRHMALLLAPAFLGGFIVYELGLFAFASLVGGTATFTAPIVLRILLNDASWLAALLVVYAVLSRAAPRAFGPGQRLGAA